MGPTAKLFFSICFGDHVVIFTILGLLFLSLASLPVLVTAHSFRSQLTARSSPTDDAEDSSSDRDLPEAGTQRRKEKNTTEKITEGKAAGGWISQKTPHFLISKALLSDTPSGYLHRPSGAPLETPSFIHASPLGNLKLGSESSVHIQAEQIPATGNHSRPLMRLPVYCRPKRPLFATLFFDIHGKVGCRLFTLWRRRRGLAKWRSMLSHRPHRRREVPPLPPRQVRTFP